MRATTHAPHLPYPALHEPWDEGVLGPTVMVRSGAICFDLYELFSDNPVGAGYTLDPYHGCDVVNEPAPTNGYSIFPQRRVCPPR